MIIDKYLYEIIDDYKDTTSEDDRTEIFNDFCSSIWSSQNKRRVYTKTIKFNVRNDLLESDIGQVFNTWSEVEYVGYKSMTKDTEWYDLIRQKINNLYTRYFDKSVILKKDYMGLLKTPKKLYYRWANGEEMDSNELTDIIDNAIYNAEELKKVYQKQKMELSWSEYKKVIEGFLLKIFNNCQLIENYESRDKLINIYDFISEDNFYVSYICKSLEGEMLKWQKQYYHLKRGRDKRYKRCRECGDLIENTGKNTQYCADCRKKKRKETKRNWWNKTH